MYHKGRSAMRAWYQDLLQNQKPYFFQV